MAIDDDIATKIADDTIDVLTVVMCHISLAKEFLKRDDTEKAVSALNEAATACDQAADIVKEIYEKTSVTT